MERKKVSWFILILTSMMLSVVGYAFASANELPSALGITLFIVATCLVLVSPLPSYVKRPLEILFVLLTCYHYFSYQLPFSWAWIKMFSQKIILFFMPTHASDYGYLPENIALVIFLIAFMFFCEVILHFEHWQTPYMFSLSYLVVLMIANESDHRLGFAAVTTLGLALAFLIRSQAVIQTNWRGALKPMLSLAIICGLSFFAWMGPHWLPKLHQKITLSGQQLAYSAQRTAWYKQLTKDSRNTSLSFLGYSDNNEFLGGPVQARGGMAFEALASKPHYWRVASKDIYTGRGWTDSEEKQIDVAENPFTQSTYQEVSQVPEAIEINLLDSSANYLPRPFGNFDLALNDGQLTTDNLTYAPMQERLKLKQKSAYKRYNFEIYTPNYTAEELVGKEAQLTLEENTYLLLPTDLPERVSELARTITTNENSDYGRLKAIESYLRDSEEFQYSLEKAERLPQNRDFVDHFLFDSKIGYCEHYSTAMVVMARSVGIPTRWVKGFSPGQNKGLMKDGRNLYEVTQNNAHAWVEAYFETVGWVPFEPTKGFGGVSENQGPVSEFEEPPLAATEQSAVKEETKASEATVETTEATGTESSEATAEKPAQSASTQKFGKQVYLVGLGLVLLIGGALFSIRERLAWAYLLVKIKWWPNYRFTSSFKGLLQRLAKISQREPAESLASYLERLYLLEPALSPSLGQLFTAAEAVYYQANAHEFSAKELVSDYQLVGKVVLHYTKKTADSE